MNYLHNCKCLRVKNICLFKIKMLRYLQSSFQGEYCDKVYYQIYFMANIHPLGMSYYCSSCLGNIVISIWASDKFSDRWRSSMGSLYSSSEVVRIMILEVPIYWALLFWCKKSTKISLAASASISPLIPYSSNQRSASLVESLSSWNTIGICTIFSSFFANSSTLFPCFDIVPSILYGIPIMIIVDLRSCIHFGRISRRSFVSTVFQAKQNHSTE